MSKVEEEQIKAMQMIAEANKKTGHRFNISSYGPWVCDNCDEEDWSMTKPPTGKGKCPKGITAFIGKEKLWQETGS